MHEQIVGRKQQPAEDQADREDIGPHGGEVHFQQSASGRAEVAAGADHRARRELRHGHGGEGRQPGQRDQPAAEPRDRLGQRAAGQEHGVEHAQRKHEVIGPQSQGGEQVSADEGPRAAADVEDFRAFGIDELAGRIAGVVAQQRSRQEHGERKQAEGQQVLFQITLFEHETRRPGYRGPLAIIAVGSWAHPCPMENPRLSLFIIDAGWGGEVNRKSAHGRDNVEGAGGKDGRSGISGRGGRDSGCVAVGSRFESVANLAVRQCLLEFLHAG